MYVRFFGGHLFETAKPRTFSGWFAVLLCCPQLPGASSEGVRILLKEDNQHPLLLGSVERRAGE
jgi:hypothetical protein